MADPISKSNAVVGIGRSLIIGLAIVLTAGVLGKALIEAFRIKHQEKRITVTGSATRRIKSDTIVWQATVRSQNPELVAAYKKLAADVPAVVEFIKAHGIPEGQIKVESATVQEIHPVTESGVSQDAVIATYVAEQEVQVETADIPRVEQISREATQLLEKGIYVQSSKPMYLYTKLAPLKIQMLADASKDARLRAEQIATNTRASLGKLITARMGVLQINEKNSTEVSAEGNSDKSSLEKDVLAVVTASFEVQ